METVDSDKARPVAPPKPISPALSSTAAPKPPISRTASPTHAHGHASTPDSTSTRAIAVETKSPVAPDSAISIATDAPLAAPHSATEPQAATPSMLRNSGSGSRSNSNSNSSTGFSFSYQGSRAVTTICALDKYCEWEITGNYRCKSLYRRSRRCRCCCCQKSISKAS
ncbi:hypothetical protein FCULG_00004209 [Fusarium culmorum]|uniref:Uncharacterized protein n=1 Tax=Fusarium culmorum TaxID=5516 RepID=A0A2T4H701_FUSCU|nr:hypothetical protein FCULG_00004209 [Fusarium culmorum]